MKIEHVSVHNFRSFIDASFSLHGYTLLAGANNCGKSNLINALRIFYDDAKWTSEDWPRIGANDDEAWIEITYALTDTEHKSLPEKYHSADKRIRFRKYLKSERVKANQSNIYAYLPDGTLEPTLFFGAKNIGQAKPGTVVYIPALSAPNDHLKTSGPSPLRNIFSFILKRMVASSPAYERLQKAFTELNTEAQRKDGLLAQLAEPMNQAIAEWGITVELDIRSLSPEDFAKSLVQHSFNEQVLGEASMPLERFGHGFQRTVIYEFIRLAPKFHERTADTTKKEFSPDFTLILFEEPEAFLHPDQQINMALSLRQLGYEPDQQVLITTHSPVFVSKSADDLAQIVRIWKSDGISSIRQLTYEKVQEVFGEGKRLAVALESFCDNPEVPDSKKVKARKLLRDMPEQEVAEAEERFRYQLWLDSSRTSIFFANKVIVCEGLSEWALFNYLLENEWHDLRPERISILDALGKYNIHRYLALLDAFAIPHAVIIDGDDDRDHHVVINDMIEDMCGEHTLCRPLRFPHDLEEHLDLPKPAGDRKDRKPIMILHAVSNGDIDPAKLDGLKSEFIGLCAADRSTRTQMQTIAEE